MSILTITADRETYTMTIGSKIEIAGGNLKVSGMLARTAARAIEKVSPADGSVADVVASSIRETGFVDDVSVDQPPAVPGRVY